MKGKEKRAGEDALRLRSQGEKVAVTKANMAASLRSPLRANRQKSRRGRQRYEARAARRARCRAEGPGATFKPKATANSRSLRISSVRCAASPQARLAVDLGGPMERRSFGMTAWGTERPSNNRRATAKREKSRRDAGATKRERQDQQNAGPACGEAG